MNEERISKISNMKERKMFKREIDIKMATAG
jgi:hypothetical protein